MSSATYRSSLVVSLSNHERRPQARPSTLRRAQGSGRAFHRAILAACLILFVAVPLAAQPQPTVSPAPAAPEFLPRYDFHMSIDRLMRSLTPQQQLADKRFSWDSHYGGSFDLVDYVAGRATVTLDYQAVMGSEFRPFDPNQANYMLEASVSGRSSEATEAAVIFHHVSRHISDRPKTFAVAWNLLGGRFLHRVTAGTTTLDVALEGGRIVQRSYVDYRWLGELNLLVRHTLARQLGVFAHGTGQLYAVDKIVVPRGNQAGGRIEAGIRLHGRGGAMEIFAGYEKRVDAHPLDRLQQRWGLAGLRLLSR
jgi:hypothetical protein